MNRLLDVWEILLSFSKYLLSNTFSQNIDNCSVAFSLLFSILDIKDTTMMRDTHCSKLMTSELRFKSSV